MKKGIVLFIGLALFSVANPQACSANSPWFEALENRIYQSFVTGDIPLWERTVAEMERYYRQQPSSAVLYGLLLARYGLIAFSLDEDTRKARFHLDKAEEELEVLFRDQQYLSKAYALQGAFLGFRISLRPLAAIRLGPRSYRAIDNAIEADSLNPAAWMERGNSLFYTPSTFGGSKQGAVEAYQRAIQLFEQDMQPRFRWLYLNTLVGLAKGYQYLDRNSFTIATYRKSLTFEPEFKWVRDELLPEALRRN